MVITLNLLLSGLLYQLHGYGDVYVMLAPSFSHMRKAGFLMIWPK